ncbi:type VI secretion system contractile sheath domain-containing protein [Frigidibacter sp. ROC022]|uniref:type VI secretion system contractile sheath domain-containing protein n=1 Tax=Frigidibacter sp. ROC022 TaxID=2971796 RepID=UPI00215A2138|nr:type VI secretion system contractile sheath large subunit [Frigidibacter sp. ROC022]MCR8723334.1 type VI secretion system contractile sheath large subunit [Frigidibacter sp. ROC022]
MADTLHSGTGSFAFGSMGKERPDRASLNRSRFRMAIMGDFSGRAAKGEIETGEALAKRRAIKLDVDTIEDVIEGFATTLVLPIGKKGAGIEVKLNGIDDLHPDELFENVELFEGLVALRRQLGSGKTSESAVKTLKEWGKEHGRKVSPPKKSSRGNKVPADRKLTDFQKLMGDKAEKPAATPADELIARIVGPHVKSLPDADAPALQEAVDEALSDAMRLVLHHPEFQSVEAQWRMLDLIARSIETDDDFDIILYDISAEEIAADLASVEDLTESGLYQLLAEGTPDGRGNFSALIGLYTFEETPPHAELLGRVARLAAHIDAPFVSAMAPGFMDIEKKNRHPLVAEAWDGLRAMPEAGHVALATPRFLLRRPYGKKTDPISEFDFEEFTPQEGMAGMLWANPAVFVAILLALSYKQNGAAMKLGSVMQLGGQPYHFVVDQYGDQIQLPCTERNITQAKAVKVLERGFMPVLTIKGRDEIRLAAFMSLAGKILLGPWSKTPAPEPSPPSRSAAPATASDDDADSGAEDDDDLDALLAGDDDDAGSDDGDVGDDDLDSLLSGLDDEGDTGGDDDLDALLAGFDDDSDDDDGAEDDAGDEEEMDPELAALLESL